MHGNILLPYMSLPVPREQEPRQNRPNKHEVTNPINPQRRTIVIVVVFSVGSVHGVSVTSSSSETDNTASQMSNDVSDDNTTQEENMDIHTSTNLIHTLGPGTCNP